MGTLEATRRGFAMTTKTTIICDVCRKEIYAQDSLIFNGERYYLEIKKVKLIEYVSKLARNEWEREKGMLSIPKEHVCINCFCRIMDSIRDELDSNNGEIKQ
jgi:hypothetical protein